ncbi:MAG: glycosyltransferase [Prevotella sp.]|jgi:glycosyltransferase involved in cell wall biosynthesis|nr:glycosyltransferase [Prevotella sp.]
MKFTVITVNYNNREGLLKTLKSVTEQTCKDFEYLVIDGGSTDGSVDAIKEYADRINYWVSEPDKGVYQAMNKGIALAKGDYLNFMNSGDCFYDAEVLEHMAAKQLTEDLIVGHDYHFDEGSQQGFYTILPPRLSMLNFVHHTLPHQSTFFKRQLFDEVQYDETLKIASDLKFYIHQICVNECSVRYVDDAICRREPDGISKAQYERRLKEHSHVVSEVLPPGAVKDYETLYQLDKWTMFKLFRLLENAKGRKWLTYCIKVLNRLIK